MKIFYRLILLFVLLSLFSVHSFAKKKETKAQTPPVLDGIWEIKFGDSIDTVKQIMEQRGFVAKLQKDGVQQLICELSKNKKVTYEDLQVSKVNFRFDANIEKLEEIQIFFNPSQKKLGKDDPVYNLNLRRNIILLEFVECCLRSNLLQEQKFSLLRIQ